MFVRVRIAVFSVTVFYDERVVIVAEQRPDASEEDSFQWMSRVLQVNMHIKIKTPHAKFKHFLSILLHCNVEDFHPVFVKHNCHFLSKVFSGKFILCTLYFCKIRCYFFHNTLKTQKTWCLISSVGYRQHPSGGPVLSGSGPCQHLT